MATLTLKIDSEDLARDVLEFLGYLPVHVEEADEEEEETDEEEEEDKIPELIEDNDAPEPASGRNLGTDIDYVQESFSVKNAFEKEVATEQVVLQMNKDALREKAMAISDENERFSFLLQNSISEALMIREAANYLIFEFIANRDIDPTLIAEVAKYNNHLFHHLYRYKESEFLVKYKNENGV